jgi:hypothetical protein
LIRVEATETLLRCGCLFAFFWVIAGATPGSAATRPQIAGLQVALRVHGLYSGPIDGAYGPATARGLRRFQRGAGLKVDGRFGRATRRALGPLGRPSFGSRTQRLGAAGLDVSVTQFLLAQSSSALAVDGYFGAHTEQSLRRFQRAQRLAVDGIAGHKTLAALLAAASTDVVGGDSTMGIGLVRALINHWTAYYSVDRTLVRALAWMESGYQSNLTSSAGAWGVMQILPLTWRHVETTLIGRKVQHTVSGNIRVGVAFLRDLLRQFDGDKQAALAAWYQGPTSLRKHGPFRTTRLFVSDVLALEQRFT